MKQYLTDNFYKTFKQQPDFCLSCGGRFEVLGNHTDHNHGLCIAATCSLSIYAAVRKRDDLKVHFYSEGYPKRTINLSSVEKVEKEKGQPKAIIRGIASYLSSEYHYGGFDIYLTSNIPSGAGVSSSAAFELLIAQVFNIAFNDGKIPLMTLCKAGQFAERYYYGKMCGLLDQIGVAYGGLVYIDFQNIDEPIVKPLKAKMDNYSFVIVNTGGSHAKLSHLYDAIPDDMHKVASYFNKAYLREVDEGDFNKNKEDVIEKCGQLAYERALHFYGENNRVKKAQEAIKNGDFRALISLMNESRVSSTELLHNMYVDQIKSSPLEACNLIDEITGGKAGVKINGGGFAGSVIALVPNEHLDDVVKITTNKYGTNNVHLINVRYDIPKEM